MAYSLLVHAGAGSANNTIVTTSGIDTTGATLIVVGVVDYNGGTQVAPSDNKSNTYTGLTTQINVAGGTRCRLYYLYSPSVGSGHTFTYDSANTYPAIFAAAFSGSTASPFDQQNGAEVTLASTLATGSVTPSEANEIVFALCGNQVAGGMTIDSGFTELDDVAYGSGTNLGGLMAYLIQTSAAAANPTFTAGGNTSLAAAIATFKSASTVSTTDGKILIRPPEFA